MSKNFQKMIDSTGQNDDGAYSFYQQVDEIYRKQWADKKLFTNYPTDGIVVKINSRKLQLIREKSYGNYSHWAMAIKY